MYRNHGIQCSVIKVFIVLCNKLAAVYVPVEKTEREREREGSEKEKMKIEVEDSIVRSI